MKKEVLQTMGEIKECGVVLLGMLRTGNNTAENIRERVVVLPEIMRALNDLIPKQIYGQYEEFFSSFCVFCNRCNDVNFLIENVDNLDESLEVFIECIKLMQEEYNGLMHVCAFCNAETIYGNTVQGYTCPKCGAVDGKIDYEYIYNEDLCKNGPLVSVVMSAYNHGEFVADAIESVINQTYKNIEFIVADDCSTDNTVEVMKRYSEYFAKAFYYDENIGGRGKGLLQHTTGKYIALMNSDDVWELDKLEIQVAYMEKHPECGACFSWCDYADEKLQPMNNKMFYQKNRSQTEWMRYFWNYGNVLCNPSSVVRREYKMKDPRYGLACWQLPDFFRWVDLIQQCEIYIIPKTLIKMRRYNKKNVTNVSACSEEAKYRATIEDGANWINVIRNMDNKFFKEVFKGEMIYPDADSEEQIKCEKYFILLSSSNPFVQNSAFIYLHENINEIQKCLYEKYNYYKKQMKEDIMNYGLANRIWK